MNRQDVSEIRPWLLSTHCGHLQARASFNLGFWETPRLLAGDAVIKTSLSCKSGGYGGLCQLIRQGVQIMRRFRRLI